MSNEIDDVHDFTSVGVDEGLEPMIFILDLDDMGQGDGAVLLREEFESGGMIVVNSKQSLLSNGDGRREGDGSLGGGNGR